MTETICLSPVRLTRTLRSPRAVLVAVALVALAGCGDDSASSPTSTSATSGAAADKPAGQLMFSRFTEATHTFDSTHIARPDGTGEVELRLPGPEGGGRWSHDGSRIAVMTVLDDDRIGTAVIEPDGTVDRVLAIPDPTLNLVCVVWSPDDQRLACEGWDDTDDARQGIYTVDASDGSDLQRLTSPPAGVADRPGDYSPDGAQLVLLRSTDEEGGQLMTVSIDGGEPAALADGQYEDPGRFSPDGASVLTSDGHELVVLDLDGEPVGGVAEPGANLFGAVWSPDGAWIAYSRGTDGPFADVFVSRPDGSDRRQVTDTRENEITVEWGSSAGMPSSSAAG